MKESRNSLRVWETTASWKKQKSAWLDLPHWDPHDHTEVCGGGTSTRPEPGPGTGHTEAAGSTPARWAERALGEEDGFLLSRNNTLSTAVLEKLNTKSNPTRKTEHIFWMCTSVAAINDVWKVSKSLIAVVALTAAEEDLRVFLHRHTLLPLKKKKKEHINQITTTLLTHSTLPTCYFQPPFYWAFH